MSKKDLVVEIERGDRDLQRLNLMQSIFRQLEYVEGEVKEKLFSAINDCRSSFSLKRKDLVIDRDGMCLLGNEIFSFLQSAKTQNSLDYLEGEYAWRVRFGYYDRITDELNEEMEKKFEFYESEGEDEDTGMKYSYVITDIKTNP